MTAYATLREFYGPLGLRADAFVVQPRAVTVDLATSRFLLPCHGLADGDLVRFVAQGTAASLPEPLSPATLYAVATVGADVFSAGVSLVNAGSGILGIVADVNPKVLASLEYWSRWVDYHLTNYSPPLSPPVPGIITMLVCHLAAYDLAIVQGLANPQYQQSAEPLRLRAMRAQAILDDLKKGGPIPGVVVDQTPAVVEGGAIGWSDEPRGWSSGDGVLR